MKTADVVLWIALVLNVGAMWLNVWSIWKRQRLIDQQREQLIEFGKCVALVAFLSRPESGAPENLRAQCAALIPPGVTLHIEEVGRHVH